MTGSDDAEAERTGPAGDALAAIEADDRFTGTDRYIAVAETFLDVRLTAVQRRVCRAVADHQRVHVQAGNGVGKSFTAAVLNLAFLLRHPDSINIATSGTFGVLEDVLWKPMRRLHSAADLPGRTLESPPRIELADEWYFKAVSPRHPSNLEGRHAGTMLVTIEEIDKPDITRAHFDSAGSLLTGPDDRLLAIGNPPTDETNVANDLRESDRWHSIQFSSFDSHNVRVDAGERDAERVEGLVDLATIQDDWRNWNGTPWPGIETARTAHRDDASLDQRWYRRRAGVMPPHGAAAHRPIDGTTVETAADRVPAAPSVTPDAVGIDVARSGDHTVMVGVHGDDLRVHYSQPGANHAMQEARVQTYLNEWQQASASCPVVIDAVGEGSGLADRLDQAYPRVERFKAGATAREETEYHDCRTEALAALGEFLADGGAFRDQKLREELLVAARTVEFEETYVANRGRNGATVLRATAKDAVTDRLGRSPDHLDAAAMAVWGNKTGGPRKQLLVW